ncbi:ATP-grasp domain-containing protein, partial [Myxococcota bacterium]|nr:ATP-grasp domain-containing protein [Myxococcota bacterium]
KAYLAAHGVPTPAYRSVAPGEDASVCSGLEFPLFVKPRSEDASLGIGMNSRVTSTTELAERIAYIHRTYGQDALVEQFIAGREFNVALVGNNPSVVLPISEIIFDSRLTVPIVTYEGKWQEDSDQYTGTLPRCPAPLEPHEEAVLHKVAKRAYDLCGLQDYGRVDIRMEDGVPFVLEVNANPDISPEAGLARSARIAGIPYDQLIRRIVEYALSRRK